MKRKTFVEIENGVETYYHISFWGDVIFDEVRWVDDDGRKIRRRKIKGEVVKEILITDENGKETYCREVKDKEDKYELSEEEKENFKKFYEAYSKRFGK